MNLGWTKEDDSALVAENRRCFLQAVCDESDESARQRMVTSKQVHSATIRVVREADGVWEGILQSEDG